MEKLSIWLLILLTVLMSVTTASDQMTMDEAIMKASRSHDAFDLFQDMGDGHMMMLMELDMLMTEQQVQQYRRGTQRSKRKAVAEKYNLLWENGVVYYQISPIFNFEERAVIKSAIAEWEEYTCLKFREQRAANYIMFQDGDGCSSLVGRQRSEGMQPINLGRGCRHKGIIIHEIGHAIGWIHEQSRPDRDSYIYVDFGKITSKWRDQYKKADPDFIDSRGVEYDYSSVMHYSGKSMGNRVITTLQPEAQNLLGQREGLSFRDIKLANLMYKCASIRSCEEKRCPGEGFQAKDCTCKCPGSNDRRLPLVPCDGQPQPTAITTPFPRTITTPGPSVLDCMDLMSNCATLQSFGACESDPARMSVFCRKTCQVCKVTNRACMDYDEKCSFYASLGFCDQFGDLVQEECPLACGVCKVGDPCQADAPGAGSGSSEVAGISVGVMALMFTVVISM